MVIQCSVHAWISDSASRTEDLYKHFNFCNSIQQCVHTEEATDLAAIYQVIKAYQEISVSNNKICMHYSLSSALLHSHHSHIEVLISP
jgi:hypothetical protein